MNAKIQPASPGSPTAWAPAAAPAKEETDKKEKPAAQQWTTLRLWLAPVCAVLLYLIALGVALALGMSTSKALAVAMVVGGTIAWLDARALSLELTSLVILFMLVATQLLTFSEAFAMGLPVLMPSAEWLYPEMLTWKNLKFDELSMNCSPTCLTKMWNS